MAHALTTSRSVVSFSLLTRPPGDLFSTPRVGSRHPLHRDMGGGGASRDLIRQGVSKLGVCVMQSNHAVLHRRSQVSQLIHLVPRGSTTPPFYMLPAWPWSSTVSSSERKRRLLNCDGKEATGIAA